MNHFSSYHNKYRTIQHQATPQCVMFHSVNKSFTLYSPILRPGEQFKAKKSTRRGGATTGALEPVAEDVGPTGAEEVSASADTASSSKIGASACVQVKLNNCGNRSVEIAHPLVLRTPKDARHLVS